MGRRRRYAQRDHRYAGYLEMTPFRLNDELGSESH
jgi:hypothetical protein